MQNSQHLESCSEETWLSHPFPSPQTRSPLGSLTRSAELTTLLKPHENSLQQQGCARAVPGSSPEHSSLCSIRLPLPHSPCWAGKTQLPSLLLTSVQVTEKKTERGRKNPSRLITQMDKPCV